MRKTFKKNISLEKGQESNRLLVLRELMRDLDLFETIKNPPRGFFNDGTTSVSKGNYRITLIVEEINE